MDPELLDLLRDDLASADYRLASVRSLLGAPADEARSRGVLLPARRVLSGREESQLGALIRLFLLGDALSGDELDRAFPSLGAEGAASLGIVEQRTVERSDAGGFHAALSLGAVELPDPASEAAAAKADWWLLSDLDDHLRGGPARPDHVMGVGGATRSLLAQAPIGDGAPVPRSAFDLGTGCGVVALQLARAGVPRVVATDVSERALDLARANARLNGAQISGFEERIEFRLGNLFDPVADERFDLILSNPPFVITPRGDEAAPVYEYRDAGLRGDELAERVVREGPALLRPGGTLLCLANWEHPWGGNGLDRVRGWIEDAQTAAGPLAGWAIERDRLDPVRYAETWARDGGSRPGEDRFDALMSAWADDFAARRIAAIGLGAVRVRREDRSAPIRVEHVSDPFSEAPGPALGLMLDAAFDAGVSASRMSAAEMLGTRWLLDEAVEEVRAHFPGQEAPRSIVLRTVRPISRSVAADPLLAAAVGACDGELSLGQIAGALAEIFEVAESAVADALIEGVRELAWFGMLTAADR